MGAVLNQAEIDEMKGEGAILGKIALLEGEIRTCQNKNPKDGTPHKKLLEILTKNKEEQEKKIDGVYPGAR